jgi:pimeloyl-ACP methyl ester carboxylesterase
MSNAPSPWLGLHVVAARRGYATTPFGQVHYASAGEGKPIVLLHQTPWFGVQYAKVQPLLGRGGFRAIAIDTPGYGHSDLPDHPPTVEEYADNLIPLLDHFGIGKAVIAGHHTGASIAAGFAARHPARTAALVLHGVPLYTPEERAERMANQLHPDTDIAADGSHLTRRWSRVADRFARGASLESVQWSVLAFWLAGRHEWYGHRAAFTFDMATALTAIAAPTLIVSNTADSLHAAAARALKLRPDFAYQEFPGGTSHLIYDEADAWAAAVLAFLATL